MELLATLNWRYATKRMNGTAVPQDKLDNILEAIRLAPSSAGLQPYEVLVITNPELKAQLRPVANNQPQIEESGALLVFAAWDNLTNEHIDRYISLIASERGVPLESLDAFSGMLKGMTLRTAEENFNWAARSAYIALGFGLVAAASEQVDATPMEGFNAAQFDEILGLKEKGLRSVVIMTLGYRDEANDYLANAKKVRRPKEQLFQVY
jgi:nitroreductase